MHFTRYPGCTSLLEPDPAVIDLFSSIGTEDPFGNFQVMRREPVQTVRLDDLEGLRQPDLIKIDVQGAELTVLEHGTKTLARSLVVETEVEFLPLYKNQPLFGDVQVFMRDRGFVLHKLIDVAGRSLRPTRYRANPYAATSQLLWADAVFVRDFTNLKGYTDEDLAVAGAILHDVYRSFDLALFLLSELDRRRQSDMAARYIAAIQASPAEARERLYLNLKEFV